MWKIDWNLGLKEMCQLYWLLVASGIQQGSWRLNCKIFIDNLDCRTEFTFSKFTTGIKLVVGRMGLGGQHYYEGQCRHSGGPQRLRNWLMTINHQ